MKKAMSALTLIGGVAFGCGDEAITQAPEIDSAAPAASGRSAGLVRKAIPEDDPGPPYYARVGLQFYADDGVLAIPFYRDPGCVPADFNLLQFFHFPGPDGLGAFACPLRVEGSLLTEVDATPGTFPRRVDLRGQGVPIWFVDLGAFEAAADDGVVTMAELESIDPIRGAATRFAETLHPRDDEHLVVIRAQGRADGRRFRLGVTDVRFGEQRVHIDWSEEGRPRPSGERGDG